MLAEELDVLNIVAQNPVTSQRKIAEQTGISLGQVNFLMKKFAKKGLIKIEAQTPKSLRYNLTPKGIAEKTEKSLAYMKTSYSVVQKLTARIREISSDCVEKGCRIYLLGSQDEMMELCKISLHELHAEYRIGEPDEDPAKVVVFYWEPDKPALCEGFMCVNLLE